jgi:hypothetical protein
MLKRIGRIFLIVNTKTAVVTVLAVAATWLCERYGLTADLPLTLVTIAVVFPIVFSIGGAYKRRETALNDYGAIKANGQAIFFAARDWLEEPTDDVLERAKQQLGDLMTSCRYLFSRPIGSSGSAAPRNPLG